MRRIVKNVRISGVSINTRRGASLIQVRSVNTLAKVFDATGLELQPHTGVYFAAKNLGEHNF